MRYVGWLVVCCVLACTDGKLRPVLEPEPPVPQPEQCNGLDDDLDGWVDAYAEPCTTACGTGQRNCIQGEWGACSVPEPKPEVCNGRDDDCDGETDEPEDLSVSPCYPWDPETLKYGECRFGLERCKSGVRVCTGPIPPLPEICNGKDDDCDGETDEGFDQPLDVVFIYDNSGSMYDFTADVKTRLAAVLARVNGQVRLALVGAPAPNTSSSNGPTPVLLVNFTDVPGFLAELAKQDGLTGSAYEPTIDAAWACASPTNPLGLTWKATDRRCVLLTDEEPQTYSQPPHTTAEIAYLKADVHVFTITGWAPQWAVAGIIHDLKNPDFENVFQGVTCP